MSKSLGVAVCIVSIGGPALATSELVDTAEHRGRERRAVCGFFKLPPGYVTFQFSLANDEALHARTTLQIRAGQITYARIYSGYL